MAKAMKNKNSSPPNNEENYAKNSQLIAYKEEGKEKLEKILQILEEEKLLTDLSFDRLDTNVEKEHYHFYFNKVLNYNAIAKLVNDYIKYGIVNRNKIEKEKIKVASSKILRLYGVLSRKIIPFDPDNRKIKRLVQTTENHLIFYIVKDKDGVPIAKPFHKNVGIAAKPDDLFDEEKINNPKYHTLQGKYDFSYTFNRDVDDIKGIVKKTRESVVEAIGKKYDISLIDLKVSVRANELNVAFNNLLIDANNPEKLYMISSKNMNFKLGGLQEIILKKLSDKLKIRIITQKVAMWKDEESRMHNLEYKLRQDKKEIVRKLQKVDKEIPTLEKIQREGLDNGESKSDISILEERIEQNQIKLRRLEEVKEILDVSQDMEGIEKEIQKDRELLAELHREKESDKESVHKKEDLDFMQEVQALATVEEVEKLIEDIHSKIAKLEEVREFANVAGAIEEWKEKLSIATIVQKEMLNEKRFEKKITQLETLFQTLQIKEETISELSNEIKGLHSLVEVLNNKIVAQEERFVEILNRFESKFAQLEEEDSTPQEMETDKLDTIF